MKYLKSYKIFESLSVVDFCERYLQNYKIVGNEVNVNGEVRLYNKGLEHIPIKFESVNGFIDVRNNKLESFEFLPEECSGNYLIEGNPGIKGLLKDIVISMTSLFPVLPDRNEVSDFYRPIFNQFIQKCLEYDVWYEGQTIEPRILEAWTEIKLKSYKENKDAFIFGKYQLITLDDEDILIDYFKLDINEDWVMELVEKLVNKLKSDNLETRRFYLKLFASLISQDDDLRIKEVISDTYDLSDIYKQSKGVKQLNDLKVDTLAELVRSKLTRSEEHLSRDQSLDLFVFIAKPEFVENPDGSYRKKLGIENFLKMNIYDPTDLQSISMMRMRASLQMADVYMIWIPKDTFEEEKDSYSASEIPDWMLKLIDEKKTKI